MSVNSLTFVRSGIKLRWRYFSICFSKMSTMDGRTNTTVNMPKATPFAITKPISKPSLRCMKHSARKPKTVVSELPAKAAKLLVTAAAIASSRVG